MVHVIANITRCRGSVSIATRGWNELCEGANVLGGSNAGR